jgi:MFS family permease
MLGLALLAQVSVSVIVQGAPTLAPFAQADLGLTRGEVGLFNSALMSGSLVMMLVAGWVVDVKGERVALVGGNLIVGAFCLCMLPTHSFAAALGVLFMAGVGGAFPTPAGSKTVMGWFPPALRGTAMGTTYNLARAAQIGAPVLVSWAVDGWGLAGGLSRDNVASSRRHEA